MLETAYIVTLLAVAIEGKPADTPATTQILQKVIEVEKVVKALKTTTYAKTYTDTLKGYRATN